MVWMMNDGAGGGGGGDDGGRGCRVVPDRGPMFLGSGVGPVAASRAETKRLAAT